jgi:predicted GNAT family N-acyltransferase
MCNEELSYTIRKASDFQANIVTELLNGVTLNLLEKGINQWEYPWNFETIKKDIDNQNLYIIQTHDKIIATFSIKELQKNDNKIDYIYLYHIAVLSDFQGKKVGANIISYASQLSNILKKPLYLDCWAGNSKLKSFYLQAGLEYLGDFPEKDYRISVFKHCV